MGLIIAKNTPVKLYHFSGSYLSETRPEPAQPDAGAARGGGMAQFRHSWDRIEGLDPCAMVRGAGQAEPRHDARPTAHGSWLVRLLHPWTIHLAEPGS